MTSDSDPKESAHERAARLEAMLDEIKDEPSDVPPAGGAAETAGTEREPLPAPAPVADVSTPDLDQLDADWGDMGADESAKHGLLASPRAGAVAARADAALPMPEARKADVPTSPRPVETDDMLGGYSDDEDDDDYSAKTVIGRVPDLVALTRNQADAPLRTNLRTPRATPVAVAEPQRDVPTIRPEPKVVIDAEADFSSVAPPPAIPPAAALPGNLPRRPLSDPPNDEPTRMAPLVLDSTPPPPRSPTSRSVPPPDPAARAAEKAAADARAATRKAKERSRIESVRERKKARAEAIAKKQKSKQPRRSRPPPAPDSETEAGGATLDSLPPDGYLPGDALAGSSTGTTGTGMRAYARALPLARDWRKMAMLVVIVIALGAIVLALATRR